MSGRISISFFSAKTLKNSHLSASTSAFWLNRAFEFTFPEKTHTRSPEVTSLASIRISASQILLLFSS